MTPRRRVAVQWTETAKRGLEALPRKAQRGLLDKADALAEADDPAKVHKALVGPLQGFYRIAYGRYRAIYTVHQERRPNRQTAVTIRILFVAAGIRKDGDKRDIYQLALRLLRLGLLDDAPQPTPGKPARPR